MSSSPTFFAPATRQTLPSAGFYRVDLSRPEMPLTLTIPARSKRQVMDWSLVLASQNIPSTILQHEAAWGLEVDPSDHEAALRAIHLYRLENRQWGWRQPIPWTKSTFHWGALAWCFLLILVHWLTANGLDSFRDAGAFATKELPAQWWRFFTAILLHEDLAHLLSNTTFGLLLFGLAMARYGAGLGLGVPWLAGAAGNLVGLALHRGPYTGLGASGMVMGALGLLSIPPLSRGVRTPWARRDLLRALFAGACLFLLLGVHPKSDVLAHAGGFVAGLFFGVLLNLPPPSWLENRVVNAVVWCVFVGGLGWTSWLASTFPAVATP